MKLNELITHLSEKLNIEFYEVVHGDYRLKGKSTGKDYFINLDDAIKIAQERSLSLYHDESPGPPRKPEVYRYRLEKGAEGNWSSKPFSPLSLELLFAVKYLGKIDYKHPEFDKVQEEVFSP